MVKSKYNHGDTRTARLTAGWQRVQTARPLKSADERSYTALPFREAGISREIQIMVFKCKEIACILLFFRVYGVTVRTILKKETQLHVDFTSVHKSRPPSDSTLRDLHIEVTKISESKWIKPKMAQLIIKNCFCGCRRIQRPMAWCCSVTDGARPGAKRPRDRPVSRAASSRWTRGTTSPSGPLTDNSWTTVLPLWVLYDWPVNTRVIVACRKCSRKEREKHFFKLKNDVNSFPCTMQRKSSPLWNNVLKKLYCNFVRHKLNLMPMWKTNLFTQKRERGYYFPTSSIVDQPYGRCTIFSRFISRYSNWFPRFLAQVFPWFSQKIDAGSFPLHAVFKSWPGDFTKQSKD